MFFFISIFSVFYIILNLLFYHIVCLLCSILLFTIFYLQRSIFYSSFLFFFTSYYWFILLSCFYRFLSSIFFSDAWTHILIFRLPYVLHSEHKHSRENVSVTLVPFFLSYSKNLFSPFIHTEYNNGEQVSNRLIYDEERKYGKIPARMYWLYLKSCGMDIVTTFFLSALAQQGLRVYTDFWLQSWTERTQQQQQLQSYDTNRVDPTDDVRRVLTCVNAFLPSSLPFSGWM